MAVMREALNMRVRVVSITVKIFLMRVILTLSTPVALVFMRFSADIMLSGIMYEKWNLSRVGCVGVRIHS